MILECPACNNRYLVDPRALGENGRTVRCVKCKHQWHAKPVVEEPEPAAEAVAEPQEPEVPLAPENPEPQPIPAGSSVPVVQPPAPKRPLGLVAAVAASFLLFIVLSVIYFRPAAVHAFPQLAGVYDALGLYETEGVVLSDLAYNKEAVKLKDRHHLSGLLVNTSDAPRHLPTLAITLIGKSDLTIRHRKLEEEYLLQPGESKVFNQIIEASPDSVERIVVELGNPFELQLR